MAATYPTVFKWRCADCGLKDDVVVPFPCTIRATADCMTESHNFAAQKFGRICLGHDVVVQPKPLEL